MNKNVIFFKSFYSDGMLMYSYLSVIGFELSHCTQETMSNEVRLTCHIAFSISLQ